MRPTALSLAVILLAGTFEARAVGAATHGQRVTLATSVNALIGGVTAVVRAPSGSRSRAFRYGFLGGIVASSSLGSAEMYRRSGGPYLLRAMNAYGAGIVSHAGSVKNPVVESIRDFAYPLGPGVVLLRDGVPGGYEVDAARLAALTGGLLFGELRTRESLRLGVPIIIYGRQSWSDFERDGVARHSSFGGLFNTILLYEVEGVSQDALIAHEFYHVLQEDRALLCTRTAGTLRRRWPAAPRSRLALQLNGAYVTTDASAAALSSMIWPHDRRPLEVEAELFRHATHTRNALPELP